MRRLRPRKSAPLIVKSRSRLELQGASGPRYCRITTIVREHCVRNCAAVSKRAHPNRTKIPNNDALRWQHRYKRRRSQPIPNQLIERPQLRIPRRFHTLEKAYRLEEPHLPRWCLGVTHARLCRTNDQCRLACRSMHRHQCARLRRVTQRRPCPMRLQHAHIRRCERRPSKRAEEQRALR